MNDLNSASAPLPDMELDAISGGAGFGDIILGLIGAVVGATFGIGPSAAKNLVAEALPFLTGPLRWAPDLCCRPDNTLA
ncbi:hypothetical protein EBE87_25000 [Pseudoroseomonas wenyumeiae]|uniref:Uncharacterized protein n=1 Tax=Teichococcus wenyumeiae TaxID=2478470 RepID=A0A3A9JDJ5_9PROT|nr:hypothetical protein [Pseudoroseomonas wenyumeiae]RKK01574.1 hypothetical protein D6Z83_24245 [Pseudoroseomonas wenyumeiae]RMI16861.1 hypothetical protein EBE87_25000 [Pseudoroseomonas wenyumeiae]